MPERIVLHRFKGWRKPANTVVVSRPSRWGNPFKIGAEVMVSWEIDGISGTTVRQWGRITAECNEDAVAYFRDWMNGVVDVSGRDRPEVAPLAGHNLACWCKKGDACHADVLLELANEARS